MSTIPSVLIYGNDEQLLQTRQWVLEAAGYRVWTARELDQVERIISEEPIDLMIFCHTLTPAAYERALTSVRAKRPGVHMLVMASPMGLNKARGGENERLEPPIGPVKLVAAVEKIVRAEGAGATAAR